MPFYEGLNRYWAKENRKRERNQAVIMLLVLACAAITDEPLPTLVERWVQTGEVIEPVPENAQRYRERFETYHRLYPTLKTLPSIS